MNQTVVLLLYAALALITTLVVTPLVRGVALRFGRISPAQADRWHERPTPNVGGVAIFIGFALALAVGAFFDWGDLASADVSARAVIPLTRRDGLLLAAVLVFLVGLVDDFVPLRPSTKLVGELVAAAVLLMSGIGVWLTGVYVVDVMISLFWFIGITNALNLLDNMDGLAAGVGAIAATFMGIDFLLAGNPGLAGVAFAFTGALLGFLVHNYPPARIFMGDSGALFVGLLLAGLALSPAPGLSRSLFAVVLVPAVVLAVPILDTTFVTVTRLLEGRAVSTGGRDHTSHGLVALGIPENRAVWLLWGLAVTGGLVGLVIRSTSRTVAYALGGGLLIILTLLGLYLLTSRMAALEESHAAEKKSGPSLFDRLLRLHQRFPVLAVLMDVALVAIAYYGAYLVRWDTEQLPAELEYFQRTLAMVVAVKLVAFAMYQAYAPRWRHYSLPDVLVTIRANLLGTLLTAVVLLVVARIGLSRGVLVVDFLICTTLIIVARVSFRFLEDATERWSVEGIPVAIIGRIADAELAFRVLRSVHEPRLRPVAVVDRTYVGNRGRLRGYPVLGGPNGIQQAVQELGVNAVVVIDRRRSGSVKNEALDEYLATTGSLDVFVLRISLEAASTAGEISRVQPSDSSESDLPAPRS